MNKREVLREGLTFPEAPRWRDGKRLHLYADLCARDRARRSDGRAVRAADDLVFPNAW